MAFDEPQMRVLFPVPFVTIRLDGFEELNRRLLGEIGERRKAEPGIDRSNRYGWHSALDFFDRAEPAHAELAGEIGRWSRPPPRSWFPICPPGWPRATRAGSTSARPTP